MNEKQSNAVRDEEHSVPLDVPVEAAERFPWRNGLILTTDQNTLDITSSVEDVPPWTALELRHRREHYDAHDLSSSKAVMNDSGGISTKGELR
jgi:hypothetical protein